MYSLLQFVLVPSVLFGCGTVYKCTLNNKEWNSLTQIKDFISDCDLLLGFICSILICRDIICILLEYM